MATAKKKPSAAQLAARAKFAAAAKAGTLRKNPIKKPTRTKQVQERAMVKQSVMQTKLPVDIYIVDKSSNGKHWAFFGAYYTATRAKAVAQEMAEEYPRIYWRVKSEKVSAAK